MTPSSARTLAFSDFDRRARAGGSLRVVFFGGSLTWGANASNPQETSWRALWSRQLESHYPRARFRFFDAAIGGTGSQLGAFRLQRDVLRHNPDLVLLDFTINDDPYVVNQDRLASYEAIVRRLIEANVPVLQVRLALARDFLSPAPPRPLDREHDKIARAYGLPVADARAGMRAMEAHGEGSPAKWWLPGDATHPGDVGYAAYAQIVWQSYLDAVKNRAPNRLPTAMLHAPTYLQTQRLRLSSQPLPSGWTLGRPNRTSAWFDALMSRWLDDETIAQPGAAPFRLTFQGKNVLLFGESTAQSGSYRVLIDGKPVTSSDQPDGVFSAKSNAGGNLHHVRMVATGLDATRPHTLEIVPLLIEGQELRLESVCLASGDASVPDRARDARNRDQNQQRHRVWEPDSSRQPQSRTGATVQAQDANYQTARRTDRTVSHALGVAPLQKTP